MEPENNNTPTTSPPKLRIAEVTVGGMSCGSCAAYISEKLATEHGIIKADVSFPTKLATITYDPFPDDVFLTGDCISGKIAKLGFQADLVKDGEAPVETAAPATGGGCCASKNNNHNSENSSPQQQSKEEQTSSSNINKKNSNTLTCEFTVGGMSCASCAARIEVNLSNFKGIVTGNVNFATTTATVTFVEGQVTKEEIEAQITSLGYPAQIVTEDNTDQLRASLEREEETLEARNNFIIATVLALPLAIVVMTFHNDHSLMQKIKDNATIKNNLNALHIVELVVCSPVVLWVGRGYYVRAWSSLLHLTFTMDTLVTIGVLGSYIFSLVAFILAATGSANFTSYFETSSTLLAFMLLGKFLEINAKRQTSSAIVKLMDLSPPTALLVMKNGGEEPIDLLSETSSSDPNAMLNSSDQQKISEILSHQHPTDKTVPSSSIKKGNVVRVLAGERVPVDGTVVDGRGAVDEAMVTGESVPQEKEFGSKVIGGTLNVNQDLVVRADKVGEETMLSQILRIVREAQGTKPAIQIVADKIAGIFVPIVIVWCLGVLAVWLGTGLTHTYPDDWRTDNESPTEFAFSFFIAAIVIACPCALGLATPTAVMVGTGVGAEQGVLIKGGPTLEAARTVNCVLFDKTGTLTTGKLRVTDFILANVAGQKFQPKTIQQLLGTVESRSTHPIARCLTAAFGTLNPPFELKTELLRGSGMTGELEINSCKCPPSCQCIYKNTEMKDVVVGSLKLMEDKGYEINEEIRKFISAAHDEGRTVILLAAAGAVRICVALADEPKPESPLLIKKLEERGIRVVMVTGDNKYAAHRVAKSVGINDPEKNVFAQQLPQDKAAVVKKLQDEGHIVAFVGDGVNDSPALTQANVGIALGAGTEVAIESADAVLVRNSLADIVTFFDLSAATVNRIYLNFVWAFLYNIIALPFASGVFFPAMHWQLPPVVAGIAMIVSSLTVLVSSLLLKLFKPDWVLDENSLNQVVIIGADGRNNKTYEGIKSMKTVQNIQDEVTSNILLGLDKNPENSLLSNNGEENGALKFGHDNKKDNNNDGDDDDKNNEPFSGGGDRYQPVRVAMSPTSGCACSASGKLKGCCSMPNSPNGDTSSSSSASATTAETKNVAGGCCASGKATGAATEI